MLAAVHSSSLAASHAIARTPSASVGSAPPTVTKKSAYQLMPEMMNVTKKPSTKRASTQNGSHGSASPTKRKKKEAPVHPRLPAVPARESDQILEGQIEMAISKLQRLGLPVDRAAIERALLSPDGPVALDRHIGLLQAQRASAILQQQTRKTMPVQLPLSPTSQSSSGTFAKQHQQQIISPPATIPLTPVSLASPLPHVVTLSVDSKGRAVVNSSLSPSSPSSRSDAPFARVASRSQVVAAEIDGMGRVVLERSVLVDRLGPAGAAMAEARARGSIAPPMMTQVCTPPASAHSNCGNIPFGFGIKLGSSLPLPDVDDDELAADRQQRISTWLNTPEDEGEDVDAIDEDQPRPMPRSNGDDDNLPILPTGLGRGKSVVRLARIVNRSSQHLDTESRHPTSPIKASSAWPVSPADGTLIAAAEDGGVDCLCHRGDDDSIGGEELIQCERCRSWFHLDCVDLALSSIPEHWTCVRCTGGEMPMAWRARHPSEVGLPMRGAPTLVASDTPRVGHFTKPDLSSELALAPSPAIVRSDGKHARVSAEYSPRSPSRGSIFSSFGGGRRRLQSGAFDDLPMHDDDEDLRHVPNWPANLAYDIEPPVAFGGAGSIFPSTPSRYVWTSSDGLSHQVTPASTIDGTHSRTSSASGTRFSFPSTPSSQELLAQFDSASSMHRTHFLPSFSPVCEQSPLLQRHRRNRSSVSGGQSRANWATGPPASSAGLIKAMMGGPHTGYAPAVAKTESGLGIGFEADVELVPPPHF